MYNNDAITKMMERMGHKPTGLGAAPYAQQQVAQPPQKFGKTASLGANICAVGVGGGGNNSIRRLHDMNIFGTTTIAINTDEQHLGAITADYRLLIGKSISDGKGVGGKPDLGAKCAIASQDELKRFFKDADLVFVTLGLGGGTGTGAGPTIAKIARECGAVVIAVATTPFDLEGKGRLKKALDGLDELWNAAHSVIVLDNNKLLEYVSNQRMDSAFAMMDQLIAEIIKGIAETISRPSIVNLDLNDLRSVMGQAGLSVMMYGEGSASEPKGVVEQALSHPLLEITDWCGTGAFIHVSGGNNMTLETATDVVQGIAADMQDDAEIIWGARHEEELDNTVKVMAIITGIKPENTSLARQREKLLRKTTRHAPADRTSLFPQTRDENLSYVPRVFPKESIDPQIIHAPKREQIPAGTGRSWEQPDTRQGFTNGGGVRTPSRWGRGSSEPTEETGGSFWKRGSGRSFWGGTPTPPSSSSFLTGKSTPLDDIPLAGSPPRRYT